MQKVVKDSFACNEFSWLLRVAKETDKNTFILFILNLDLLQGKVKKIEPKIEPEVTIYFQKVRKLRIFNSNDIFPSFIIIYSAGEVRNINKRSG